VIRAVLLTLSALLVALFVALLVIPTPEERPTVSVEEAAGWFGLGRSAAYEAARRGELPSLRFGRSVRVPVAAARRLLGIDPERVSNAESDPDAEVVPLRRETGG